MFKKTGLSAPFLLLAFVIKLIFSFVLFGMYTYYYNDRSTADIYKYYDDGKIMYQALKNNVLDYVKMLLGIDTSNIYLHENYFKQMNHWYREWEVTAYNDNRIMIRINALFFLFSSGNFHIHNVFGAMLSFIGLTYIFLFFKPHIYLSKTFALLLFYLPSMLFWTSGILKESILIFFMGCILYIFQNFKKDKILWIIFLVFSLWILFLLKTYIILWLLPLLGGLYLSKKIKIKYPIQIYLGIVIILFIASLFLQNNKGYNIYYNMYKKQEDFIGLAKEMNSGSLVVFNKLPDWKIQSFIKSIPQALKISFIMKWPWEKSSFIEKISLIENYFIILLTLYVLGNRYINKHRTDSIFWFCIFFVVGIFLLIGFTTPVIGAVVRYRIPALAFWIFILMQFHSPILNKIEQSNILLWVVKKQH